MIVVVMGVCGCGKTTVGKRLAERLGAEFIEGDDLHPEANRAKMSRGVALTDDDRWPWLEAITSKAREAATSSRNVVVSCSALRRTYRDSLRRAGDDLCFVHLTGPKDILQERMAQRRAHFMPPGLLDSQLATLEAPDADEFALTLDVAHGPDSLVEAIVTACAGGES